MVIINGLTSASAYISLFVVLVCHNLHVTCFTLFDSKPSLTTYLNRNRGVASKINMSDIHVETTAAAEGTLLLSNMHRIGQDQSLQLILASSSPRRREILDMMGLSGKFTVQPSPLDEKLVQVELRESDIKPREYAKILSERKAAALCDTLLKQSKREKTYLVLGSDTIVEYDGHILEKPNDTSDAKEMLCRLSGNWHEVHTGVAVYGVFPDEKQMKLLFSFTDTAKVKFASLEAGDVSAYIRTNEPMDKAGSYGIQGIGGQMVERLDGDFFTVMGLPMHRLSKSLSRAIADLGC